MAKSAPHQWTADQLVVLLRTKYSERSSNGWDCRCFLEQVPNGVGGGGRRSWIDAAVIEFWGQDGHTRRAFEVKVSRSDYLREIANRGKNLWCREAFHEFWFVAPEGVIASAGEVPEGDGWLCPRGSGLTIKVQAKRRDAAIDDALICALMRASLERTQREISSAEKRVLAESQEHREALAWKLAAQEFLNERAPGQGGGTDLWSDEDHAKMVAGAKKRLLAAVADGDPEKVWRRRADDLHQAISRLYRELSDSASAYIVTVAALKSLLVSGACDYPGWGRVKEREWKELMKKLEGSEALPPSDPIIETARQMIARYDAAKQAAHG